ncbi:EAL domain-containing protein [Catenovulum sediminis]|uniref:EAL domain-containing protein n=1 Tax=Catenovulum sediminis TaxID=1740262 RepID=UPI00117E60B0|nr:EAL domain-containing protein [Catenovulum sediminis]
MINRIITLILLLTCAVSQVLAKPVVVSEIEQQKTLVIGEYLTYQSLPKEVTPDILVERFNIIGWQSFETEIPVLPYSQNAYWLYFELKNDANHKAEFLMDFAFPLLNNISVYRLDDNKKVELVAQSDIETRVKDRKYPSGGYIFPIWVAEQSTTGYLMRIENDSMVQVPVTIYVPEVIPYEKSKISFWLGGGLAILIVLSLFSTLIYVLSAERSFIYFATFSFSFFFYYCATTGYPIEFLWPNYLAYSKNIAMLSLGVSLAALSLFAIEFLQLSSSNKKLARIVLVFTGCSFIAGIFGLLMNHELQIRLQLIMFLACTSLVLYSAIMSLQTKRKGAYRFLFCFALITISCALFAGNRFGLIERNFVTEYSLLGSQFLAFIILFDALSERIRIERSKRLQAQIESMHHYQQFYDIYENAVEAHFSTTEDGRLLRANKAFYELLGYQSFEQLLENVKNITDLYLVPSEREKLIAKSREFGRVFSFDTQWRRGNGKKIWVSINLRYEAESPDGPVLIGSLIDISQKKKADRQLQFLAAHDSLTGLLNRREFERLLNDALVECSSNGAKHTLLYMDLDQFKVVNDTCGHKAGDILLRQLTDELKDVVGDSGLIARLGGDEFGVLLHHKIDDEAFVIAFRLKQAVQDFRFVWEGRVFTLGVSIGLVEVNEENNFIDEVLSIADTACYAAKERGRNRIHAYTESDKDVKQRHNEMQQIAKINEALSEDRFKLQCQLIYNMQKTGEPLHYEILIRMFDSDNNLVPPGMFLPAAERYGLMSQIDKWVINHYFEWLHNNPTHMQQLGKCAINLSGPSLADEDMQSYILDCFHKYQIPHEKICFEITESMAIQQLDATLSFIQCFRDLGCSFALDDFGSGFSSYGYLKNLPVDYLKIDGSFVKDMLVDPIDRAMVKSIYEVAKAIGMQTVAEFVESEDILADLRSIGINFGQGYGIAKPMGLEEFVEKFGKKTKTDDRQNR